MGFDITPEIENERPRPTPMSLPIPERGWEFIESFHRGPRHGRGPVATILWSWSAAIIDSGFVVGFSLLTLFGASLLANLVFHDLVFFLRNNRMELGAMIFVSFSFAYMLMLRSFLGFSLGEWACDLRLGSPPQRASRDYIPRVFFRTAIVFITGIIVLPAFSLLLKRDLAGEVTGLSIFSMK